MKPSLTRKLYGISIAALFVFTVTQIQTASSNRAPEILTTAHAPQYYYLREYNGKVAVFSEDGKTPDTVYDVYLRNLPDEDRKLLENGLRANNEDELQKLIEDYTS